jgi:hypothetical protein
VQDGSDERGNNWRHLDRQCYWLQFITPHSLHKNLPNANCLSFASRNRGMKAVTVSQPNGFDLATRTRRPIVEKASRRRRWGCRERHEMRRRHNVHCSHAVVHCRVQRTRGTRDNRREVVTRGPHRPTFNSHFRCLHWTKSSIQLCPLGYM